MMKTFLGGDSAGVRSVGSDKEKKIKVVERPDIIVEFIDGRPYYGIKYKEVGNDYYNIGFGSYELDYVKEWFDTQFEVVETTEEKVLVISPCSMFFGNEG